MKKDTTIKYIVTHLNEQGYRYVRYISLDAENKYITRWVVFICPKKVHKAWQNEIAKETIKNYIWDLKNTK